MGPKDTVLQNYAAISGNSVIILVSEGTRKTQVKIMVETCVVMHALTTN